MVSTIDADRWRSASHRNLIAHLTGPLGAGAVESVPPIVVEDGAALVRFAERTRQPLVVVALRRDLGPEAIRVTATVTLDGEAARPVELLFMPFTEAGAALPVARPEVAGDFGLAGPMTVSLAAARIAAGGGETAIAVAEIQGIVELHLIEGVLGRIAYLLGAEGARLRRQGREIAAMRTLATARDDALDRLGAELGIPRFSEDLRVADGQIVTAIAREPDIDYRQRLAIYRPFLLPSRSRLLDRLNGPGGDAEANAGLLAALDVTARLAVPDADNPFAVAIHLVDEGAEPRRANFIEFIRRVHLIWPGAEGDDVHAGRHLPGEVRTRQQELRNRLAAVFSWPADAAIAPVLAEVLDRYARCRAALGVDAAVTIVRAQDAAAGSRFELGLGVEIEPLEAATLDHLAEAALDPNRQPAEDREIEALLSATEPVAESAAADPAGAWLFLRCGMRTVHPLDGGTIYLSHLPTFGMAITGPTDIPVDAPTSYEVRYHAPGDSGGNVVLSTALAAALNGWIESGHEPIQVLTDADTRFAWERAADIAPAQAALDLLTTADLPAVDADDLPATIAHLQRLPPELIATLTLPPELAERVVAGDDAVVPDLRTLVGILRAHGLASVLPVVVGDEALLMVVGVLGLPRAGVNLADRRTTGFRWYAIPIEGDRGTVKAIGSRTTYTHRGGLAALVALGYARRGATDPYEFRVEMPPDELLTLKQYEYLMNLLAHDAPLGVEINTFAIRQEHVDLDGDGVADPLRPAVARTFRTFQRERHRGVTSVEVPEGRIERR